MSANLLLASSLIPSLHHGIKCGKRNVFWNQQKERKILIPKQIVRSSKDDSGESSAILLMQRATSSTFYRVGIEGTGLLGVLALIDAAYSGDWSRIGAISKEDEVFFQQIVWLLGIVHVACAFTVASISEKRGQPWTIPAAKALAVGVLVLVEVYFDGEDDNQTNK